MNGPRLTYLLLLVVSLSSSAFSDEQPPDVVDHDFAGKLVLIPAGEFLMGSPEGEHESRPQERPQHKVVIDKPFYMGAHEVTFSQFRSFVAATGYQTQAEKRNGGTGYLKDKHDMGPYKTFSWKSTGFPQTDSHPVVNVSWEDAVAFCRWLTDKDGRHFYRLPTEAEREYAARAGTTTAYHWGENPRSMILRENVADRSLALALSKGSKTRRLCANWNDRFPFTAPVGSLKPNKFGLYDTHGNVCEWCQDIFDENRYLKPSDYRPTSGTRRVFRGGSFLYRPEACRVARRFAAESPDDIRCDLGFRIVRNVE